MNHGNELRFRHCQNGPWLSLLCPYPAPSLPPSWACRPVAGWPSSIIQRPDKSFVKRIVWNAGETADMSGGKVSALVKPGEGRRSLATTVIGIGCYVSRPDVASEKRFRKCSESNSENVSETRSENQAHRRVAIQAST